MLAIRDAIFHENKFSEKEGKREPLSSLLNGRDDTI